MSLNTCCTQTIVAKTIYQSGSTYIELNCNIKTIVISLKIIVNAHALQKIFQRHGNHKNPASNARKGMDRMQRDPATGGGRSHR